MWPALTRSLALYRGTSDERIDEILSLLAENDHDALLRRRAAHLEGKLTWARLAALAIEALAPPLLLASDDAIERAHLLGVRLNDRDDHKRARVPTELRDAIVQVVQLARSLAAARALRDGRAGQEEDNVHALLALHQRWWQVRRAHPPDEEEDAQSVVLALAQAAAGAVLTSTSAHASLKSLAARAVARWEPPPPQPATQGESVAWDDDL